jgi:hypothetical protein
VKAIKYRIPKKYLYQNGKEIWSIGNMSSVRKHVERTLQSDALDLDCDAV